MDRAATGTRLEAFTRHIVAPVFWGLLLGGIIILCVLFAPDQTQEFIYTEF